MDHLCLVSPFFHYHHNTYATILIAPSAEDSKWIRLLLNDDNFQRLEYLKKHGYDSGRSQKTDWFKVRISFHCCLSATHWPMLPSMPLGNMNLLFSFLPNSQVMVSQLWSSTPSPNPPQPFTPPVMDSCMRGVLLVPAFLHSAPEVMLAVMSPSIPSLSTLLLQSDWGILTSRSLDGEMHCMWKHWRSLLRLRSFTKLLFLCLGSCPQPPLRAPLSPLVRVSSRPWGGRMLRNWCT